jgi:hypothetical protein
METKATTRKTRSASRKRMEATMATLAMSSTDGDGTIVLDATGTQQRHLASTALDENIMLMRKL